MQYVEILVSTEDSQIRVNNAGYAPYLDYRPLQEDELVAIEPILKQSFLREDIESQAKAYAIAEIVPQHLNELKQHKEELINKTLAAVKDSAFNGSTETFCSEFLVLQAHSNFLQRC